MFGLDAVADLGVLGDWFGRQHEIIIIDLGEKGLWLGVDWVYIIVNDMVGLRRYAHEG